MIYDEYLTQAELQRWILDADVAWARIDVPLARTQPDLLEQVRDSALIESYFPIYTTRLMRALWDQVDVTSVFSVQLYESYKHFYVLNRYLELVDAHPISGEELIAVRRPNLDTPIDDPIRELARYMISEHFAAYFFLRLARQAAEPVLAQIAGYIARDEFRHTQFAFDLLDVRLKDDVSLRDRVLQAGMAFRHVGADVVAHVPVSEKNDLAAILTLNKRLRRLCGVSLSEFAKGTVHGSD
ncbi:MAG: ferritin-like domain-containing protein [Vicinamibacterales bacterium]